MFPLLARKRNQPLGLSLSTGEKGLSRLKNRRVDQEL